MSKEFDECLKKRKITEFERAKELVSKELSSAASDLKSAKDSFDEEDYKWATIQAYYSMFHAARALIYSKGYREKSHYYLLVALQALFAEKGLIEEDLTKDFHTAMILREGAESSIESANEFLKKAEEILKRTIQIIPD